MKEKLATSAAKWRKEWDERTDKTNAEQRKAKAGEMAIELAKYIVSTHSAHSEYVVQQAQAIIDTMEGSNGPQAD